MPFIPFALTVGTWLGSSAAVGGTVIVAAGTTLATAVASVYGSSAQASAEKKAQTELIASQEKQQKDLISFQEGQVTKAEEKAKSAEALATQIAVDKLRKQRLSQTQTILTSPLGVTDEAQTKLPTLFGG